MPPLNIKPVFIQGIDSHTYIRNTKIHTKKCLSSKYIHAQKRSKNDCENLQETLFFFESAAFKSQILKIFLDRIFCYCSKLGLYHYSKFCLYFGSYGHLYRFHWCKKRPQVPLSILLQAWVGTWKNNHCSM